MTDDERRTRQPLSMTRRYRRGLILTGLLCAGRADGGDGAFSAATQNALTIT